MTGPALATTAGELDELPSRPTSVGWGPFLLVALTGGLLWLAGRRDWGDGAENAPYLGAAIVLLGCMPALVWKTGRARRAHVVGRVPFLPVVGVLYALYFGSPVLTDDAFGIPTLQYTGASLTRALEIALVAWIALLGGWWLARSALGDVKPMQLPLDWERARRALPYLLGIGTAAILAQRVLPLPGGLMQPVRFLQMLFQLGLGVMVLMHMRGDLDRTWRLILWLAIVPIYLFVQVGVGSVAQLAYAGIFVLFLLWGCGRRVPLVALAVGASVILLMRGHVHTFRSQTWDQRGEQADAGVWQRSTLFLGLLVERFQDDVGTTVETAVDEVSARVAHLGTFAHVTHLTPSRVPYWGGDTYAALPTTLIPRALWPGKPSKETGQAFGHRYELLAPSDRTTAVNMPIVIELYANFGRWGCVLGMFALGALYQLLHRWWNTAGAGPGTLLIGCILYSRLILIESDFTLVFGALIQTAVLLIVVLRWLGPPRERRASAPARFWRTSNEQVSARWEAQR